MHTHHQHVTQPCLLLLFHHFYEEVNGKEVINMVELHVDDVYAYDDNDLSSLPTLGKFGGNISKRIPPGCKPQLVFSQDEAIYRSSQLNESCWTVDGETTLRTKGLGVGIMASAMVSRAFALGMEIKEEDMLEINKLREGKHYKDIVAANYLKGTSAKAPLTSTPFVRYLNYGQGKEGYWTYNHMVIQIEDCTDCLKYLYPDFDYAFELDHSSGHNSERPNGLSTTAMNLGWGGEAAKYERLNTDRR